MNELENIKEAIQMFNKDLVDAKKSIDAAEQAIPANCGCSHMEWLEMENQWEPSYTCEHHVALNDAEFELWVVKDMLNGLGKDLVKEEQALAMYAMEESPIDYTMGMDDENQLPNPPSVIIIDLD